MDIGRARSDHSGAKLGHGTCTKNMPDIGTLNEDVKRALFHEANEMLILHRINFL